MATLQRKTCSDSVKEMVTASHGKQTGLRNVKLTRGQSLPIVNPPQRSTLFSGRTSARRTSETISLKEKRDFFRKYGPLGNSFSEAAVKADMPSRFSVDSMSAIQSSYTVLDPTGRKVYQWLLIVSIAVIYFIWSVIFRVAFSSVQSWLLWTVLDAVFYCIFVLDLVVQCRTSHLKKDGLMEDDLSKIFICYSTTWQFKLDVLSLLPVDWLWMIITFSTNAPTVLLFIRLLKCYRLQQFIDRSESRARFSHACRVFFMLHHLLILIHWNACIYYIISRWLGLGTDAWVYPNTEAWNCLSRKYVYCFYWSTMTLTTIGEVPSPENTLEYMFVTIDYFMGILMFATLVGNIGNILNNIQRKHTKFQNKMSEIKNYMRQTSVPDQLQERVVKWLEYLWEYNTHLDEKKILDSLPDKLKAEIGMHVHFETLKKADFFAECEQGLLWELVLRLRTQIYSPGEYVCRKGDVGREMYMVSSGRLEVMPEEDGRIVRTLLHGESFGEISVLDLGNNHRRRTAFVRSVGYSVLLCLTESDLSQVLRDYPKTKERMIVKGCRWLGNDVRSADTRPSLHRQASELSSDGSEELFSVDDRLSANIIIDQMTATNNRLIELEKLMKQMLAEMQR